MLSGFAQDDDDEYEAEIARVMREVDAAHQLGARLMRFDVAWRRRREGEESGHAGVVWRHNAITIDRFEERLPRIAAACARIADYAATVGITTSVENRLDFVQASDRVQRLIQAVGRDYYRTMLDTGHFLCVDENPVVGVMNNNAIVVMLH